VYRSNDSRNSRTSVSLLGFSLSKILSIIGSSAHLVPRDAGHQRLTLRNRLINHNGRNSRLQTVENSKFVIFLLERRDHHGAEIGLAS